MKKKLTYQNGPLQKILPLLGLFLQWYDMIRAWHAHNLPGKLIKYVNWKEMGLLRLEMEDDIETSLIGMVDGNLL